MKSPLISIVIACYNASDTLPAALDSLRAQSFRDFEIVVVDGASRDGTVELLHSYDEFIASWISEPDAGIYDAWNKGLRLTRGKWIGFLGADDIYFPNALQEYARYIVKRPDLEYISAQVELHDDEGRTRIKGEPWRWASFRHYMCVAHVGSLHARSLFEKYGLFDANYRICGDYEFLLRPRWNLRAGYVDLVLGRMHTGGISTSNQRVFWETRQAKLRTNSVRLIIALWDHYVAVAKWNARRALRRL